ncbi:MAG TPA: efflux RND transporter periplasmic adaptor subunit [Steroidobacteraceae bacterium]|jgi:membrane fusion protein (multidrug efflux system)|nr:efflux RND transporter periplasmic adaptor subunit [Steroidobacteraceae bacterium]
MASATESKSAGDAAPGRDARQQRRRHLAFRIVAIIVVIGAILAGAWYYFLGRWYESTDDAYVDGNVVQITPQIPGTVISIGADDNDYVRAGEPLVTLDSSNADVALAQAEAALAQTVRRVRGLYSAVLNAQADVAVRESNVRQAEADYRRRQGLEASGAVSAEDLAHARDALTAARSALTAAQAQRATKGAMVEDTRIASHPDVMAAAERVRAAWLDVERTTLVAPVAGYVAERTVQVGQRVQPGTPLMAVVPLREVWVDANFKETQLGRMRIGQPVTLTSDLYGGDVTFHGHIAGLGIGTGSAFSLLPAQNASGNWIKIVQRLPVRITLDPRELGRHPLRIGLSMRVAADLHDQSGATLASQPPRHPAFSTDVYVRDPAKVDAIIARIIRDNEPSAARTGRALAHGPRALSTPPAG